MEWTGVRLVWLQVQGSPGRMSGELTAEMLGLAAHSPDTQA